MKSKLGVAVVAALSGIVIIRGVIGSHALASAESDEGEIVALNQRVAAAFSRGDLDAAMAYYLDDENSIYYEDDLPFQIKGKKALRRYIQNFYRNASHIDQRVEAISVVVNGDFAAVH